MKSPIVNKVKEIVHRYDPHATITLFGSRARGDFWEESDWDFLILTDKENVFELDKKIRSDVFDEIEMVTFDSIQTILRTRKVWEEDMWMTGIYESVKEEGIVI